MKKLIEKITEYLFFSFARRKHEEVIDVRDYLSQIMTALILAPRRSNEVETACQYLFGLQECFPETQFYLLIEKDIAKTVAPHDSLQVMAYDESQINLGGLPKREVVDMVRARHFDLVIDFNQEFSLFATALCRASQAKLRVCLQHPKRDSYYNFQFRPASTNSLEMKYESLIRYLSVFKSLPEAPSRDFIPA